jgi:hypothetical protein
MSQEALAEFIKKHNDLYKLHRINKFTTNDAALEIVWCFDCGKELGRLYFDEWTETK